ncbi:antibiotic biosynthesis monooxygenase [Curtobacterium sp. MCBA15_012]|uniref:antibiotic biosynthesis monooxygenase family protein n=1 Tax=Curtobacterium sp. MCBA15_012 TaxID=1898738 RepID=UPI0008DD62C4|nr:antibiotic biosynthesis monooxygenase [Curtobacterium sp. MCBA15_012]WIB00265.1 antibiotic biosynthesis monooxygenase [Curtobacterium sp. MCBA15_012]
MSVTEIAEINILDGTTNRFEAAAAEAAAHFQSAPGCRTFELRRSVEHPNRYRLFVGWDSVEAHTIDFRQSEGFAAWRALVHTFFAEPPRVEHVSTVLKAF